MISILSCIIFFFLGYAKKNPFLKIWCALTPFLISISDSLILFYDRLFPLRPAQLLFAFYVGYLLQHKKTIIEKTKTSYVFLLFSFFICIEISNALRQSETILYFIRLFFLNEYPKYFCAIIMPFCLKQPKDLVIAIQSTALLFFLFILFEVITSFNWVFYASSIYVRLIPHFNTKLALHFAPLSISQGFYDINLKNDGLIHPCRFAGFDGNPNTSAILLAAFGLSFFGIGFKESLKIHIVRSFLIFGLIVLLVISTTRAAIFGFLLSSLTYLMLQKKILPTLLLSMLFLILFTVLNKNFAHYFKSFFFSRVLKKEEVLDPQRTESARILCTIKQPKNILFGSGGNIYTSGINIFKNNDISILGLQYATGGIFLLGSFLIFFASVLFMFYQKKENMCAALYSSICLLLFTASLSNNYNFNWIYLMLAFCPNASEK